MVLFFFLRHQETINADTGASQSAVTDALW